MAPLRDIAMLMLFFFSVANASFVLLYPPSLEGTNPDKGKELTQPCGAVTPDLSKPTNNTFHVDGDFVSITLDNPQANIMIGGTLWDGDWIQFFPIVSQNGAGNFCEPVVPAPKQWVGKPGVIGIAVDTPDGILYQVRTTY